MGTDDFRDISNEFGLDSQIISNCFKAFASYIEIPKKKWNKYHAPYKDVVSHVPVRSTEVCTTNHIVPEPYVEKIPFPAKVKEHSMIASVVNKSTKRAVEPNEQIDNEPAVENMKDSVTKNVEDGHIILCKDTSNIVSHPSRTRIASVPVFSVRISDHWYYGTCDSYII